MQAQTAYSQLNSRHPEIARSLAHMLDQGFSQPNAVRSLTRRSPKEVARLIALASDWLAEEREAAQEAREE